MTAPSLMNEAEPLLTPAEVATLFRVDAKTVSRWAKAGKLTATRTLGGHRRFKEREVRALLAASRRVEPDPMAAPVHTLWPIAATGPAAAARRHLQDEGIGTVGKLTALTALGLRDIGLSAAKVDEVRLALARKDLALRGEVLASKAA
jgi:excisionase family DNA binding protein